MGCGWGRSACGRAEAGLERIVLAGTGVGAPESPVVGPGEEPGLARAKAGDTVDERRFGKCMTLSPGDELEGEEVRVIDDAGCAEMFRE